MPITINGSGTVTGISAGGLPDDCITTADIAANAVTLAKIGTTEQSQLCKAWVNFNGTGVVAIRASYNVSSITDNGTGDYTVNFTTALADANYSAVTAGSGDLSGGANPRQGPSTSDTRSASSIRIRTALDNTVLADWFAVDLAVFR
jgi:hypothetical protein